MLAISAFMSKNSVSKVCSDCHVSLYSEQQILMKCFESPVFQSQAISDFMQPNSELRVAVGSGMVCLYSPVFNPHLRLFLKNLQVQFSMFSKNVKVLVRSCVFSALEHGRVCFLNYQVSVPHLLSKG